MNVILVLISYTFNNTFCPRRKTKYFLEITLLLAVMQYLYTVLYLFPSERESSVTPLSHSQLEVTTNAQMKL